MPRRREKDGRTAGMITMSEGYAKQGSLARSDVRSVQDTRPALVRQARAVLCRRPPGWCGWWRNVSAEALAEREEHEEGHS